MKRPRWSHIFTKGFTAVRKSLSLITRGIQDQKLGGKPIPGIGDFEFYFNVRGTKSFSRELRYKILAKKECKLVHVYNLKGTKKKLFESIYVLKALVENRLNKSIDFIGRKRFDLIDQLNLSGTKEFYLDRDLSLGGTKRFDLDLERILKASKQYDIGKELVISGTKQSDMDKQILIKGKRDIISILEALDLI